MAHLEARTIRRLALIATVTIVAVWLAPLTSAFSPRYERFRIPAWLAGNLEVLFLVSVAAFYTLPVYRRITSWLTKHYGDRGSPPTQPEPPNGMR